MKKIRLIPVVLMKNGYVVQSKKFRRFQILGNPHTIVSRLSNWCSDELIYLDISQDETYDFKRNDLNYQNESTFLDIFKKVSKSCFMPVTCGGKVKSLNDIYERLQNGSDKVAINTEAFKNPQFINNSAKEFGSQCIVSSIDSKDGRVCVECGKIQTDTSAVDWAVEVEKRGAGEILLNSIDQDGAGKGYDIDLIKSITKAVTIPVIALGGVGDWNHFEEGIEAGADAVAAANIFQYTENSVYSAKKYLYNKNYNVRKPTLKTFVQEII